MIQIINGAVGVKVGKRTVLKNRDDGPMTLDKKTEARLVALGFAEYTDGKSKAPAPSMLIEDPQESAPIELNKMKREALVQEAIKRELEFAEDATRKELIALIEESDTAQGLEADESDETSEDETEDGEPVPVITANEVE